MLRVLVSELFRQSRDELMVAKVLGQLQRRAVGSSVGSSIVQPSGPVQPVPLVSSVAPVEPPVALEVPDVGAQHSSQVGAPPPRGQPEREPNARRSALTESELVDSGHGVESVVAPAESACLRRRQGNARSCPRRAKAICSLALLAIDSTTWANATDYFAAREDEFHAAALRELCRKDDLMDIPAKSAHEIGLRARLRPSVRAKAGGLSSGVGLVSHYASGFPDLSFDSTAVMPLQSGVLSKCGTELWIGAFRGLTAASMRVRVPLIVTPSC